MINHTDVVSPELNQVASCYAYFSGYIMSGPFAGPNGVVISVRRFPDGFRMMHGNRLLNTRHVAIDTDGCLSFNEELSSRELALLIGWLLCIKGESRKIMNLDFFRF
jgi:hypothetical protein